MVVSYCLPEQKQLFLYINSFGYIADLNSLLLINYELSFSSMVKKDEKERMEGLKTELVIDDHKLDVADLLKKYGLPSVDQVRCFMFSTTL